MEKIYVWIDVRDRRYALRLADYFNKYFDEQMEARVYDPVYHKKGVKCPGRLILLTDDVFRERSLSPDRILLLAEKDGINPYQSAEQIARQVLSVQEDGENRREPETEEKTEKRRLVGIWGLHGGIGSTSLMLSLGQALAGTGSRPPRVLGLSFDMSLPPSLGLKGACHLGDLGYSFLAEDRETFRRRLDEAAECLKGHALFQIIAPPPVWGDLFDMDQEQQESFLQEIGENYDYILVDLGSHLSRFSRQVLSLCDRIFRLEDGSAEDEYRKNRISMDPSWESRTVPLWCENPPKTGESSGKERRKNPGMIFLPWDKSMSLFGECAYQRKVRELLPQLR